MLIQRIKILIFVFLGRFLSTDSATSGFLLPNNVIPLNYKIYFNHSDFNNHQNQYFSSKISINVEVLESTSHIKLHKKNLKIVSSNLKKSESGKIFDVQSESFDEKFDQLDLKFNEILDRGIYTLNIDYIGEYGKTFGLIRRSGKKSPGDDLSDR